MKKVERSQKSFFKKHPAQAVSEFPVFYPGEKSQICIIISFYTPVMNF